MFLSFLHVMGLQLLLTKAVGVTLGNHSVQCIPQQPISKTFRRDCHVMSEYFHGLPRYRVKNVLTESNVFMWNTCRFEVNFFLKSELQGLRDVAFAGAIFSQIYDQCLRKRGKHGGMIDGTHASNNHFDSFRGLLIEQAPLPYTNSPDSEDDENAALLGEGPDSSMENSDAHWTLNSASDGFGPGTSGGDNANDIAIDIADSTNPRDSHINRGDGSTATNSAAVATNAACPDWAARVCCWENDRVWERLNPAQYAGTLLTGVCSAALGAFITWRVNNPGAAAKLAEACLDATQKGVQLKGCI